MTRLFKKVKHRIYDLSIRKRLVLYGYLTITPVMVLICLVLVFNNYNKAIDEKRKNALANVNALADSVNMLQSEMKNFSTYLCIDREIVDLLETYDEKKKNNARFWVEDAPMKIISDMRAIKKYCISLAIYPENEIAPYLSGMDGSVYLPSIREVRETEIYKETLSSEKGMLWKYIPKKSKEVYIKSWTDKVVLCREIYGSSKKPLGYIAMGVRDDYFNDLCNKVRNDEDETIFVIDPDGGILCQMGEADDKLKKYFKSEDFLKQDFREREQQFNLEGYDVTCVQLEKKSSIVCKVEPKYRLPLWDVAYMPLVLLAGMLIGLLPLLLIISTSITRPLKEVSEAISKFAQGDFKQQITVTTHDEVGEVLECFNRMVGDIKRLIDENYVITLRERESELMVLQAQINPHFLYNALDCLYWKAMENDNDEIAETILALSELFRRVLSQGMREITVQQEIELVSYYLQIQKIRFSKRLNYSIEVEESVKNVIIPKLILQPFVENAIVHGFENVSTPCVLTVTAKKQDNYVCFEVMDTGLGMKPEQIAKIWEEEPVQYAKQRVGRFAIRNIKERLFLRYHENFKLEIQSSLGKGTVVTLLVPLEETEECHSDC